MFIPGILLMSCFLAVRFLRVTFLFLREVVRDLDFAFGLLIPGIFCISCCATIGTVGTSITAINKGVEIKREANLIRLMLFILPPERSNKRGRVKALLSS